MLTLPDRRVGGLAFAIALKRQWGFKDFIVSDCVRSTCPVHDPDSFLCRFLKGQMTSVVHGGYVMFCFCTCVV